jgi:hypothetical protein
MERNYSNPKNRRPETAMKRTLLALAALLLVGGRIAAQNDAKFTGEINDRACAKADSHDSMMKRHGSQNTKDCIADCVKAGGKYVLVEDGTKAIYVLDDQQKPAAFAEQKVMITGTLDKDAGTLHVTSISAAK